MTPHDMHCSSCRYWCDDDGFTGYCHRYPPQILIGDDIETVEFPRVGAAFWCGEYKAVSTSRKATL